MNNTPATPAHSAFLRLVVAQVTSWFGTSLTGFALGVWVYQTTGSVTRFALISFFTMLLGILLPLSPGPTSAAGPPLDHGPEHSLLGPLHRDEPTLAALIPLTIMKANSYILVVGFAKIFSFPCGETMSLAGMSARTLEKAAK